MLLLGRSSGWSPCIPPDDSSALILPKLASPTRPASRRKCNGHRDNRPQRKSQLLCRANCEDNRDICRKAMARPGLRSARQLFAQIVPVVVEFGVGLVGASVSKAVSKAVNEIVVGPVVGRSCHEEEFEPQRHRGTENAQRKRRLVPDTRFVVSMTNAFLCVFSVPLWLILCSTSREPRSSTGQCCPWRIRVRAAARKMPGNQGWHGEKTAENMTWTDIFGHFAGNHRETRRKLGLARWKGHHGRCRAAHPARNLC